MASADIKEKTAWNPEKVVSTFFADTSTTKSKTQYHQSNPNGLITEDTEDGWILLISEVTSAIFDFSACVTGCVFLYIITYILFSL